MKKLLGIVVLGFKYIFSLIAFIIFVPVLGLSFLYLAFLIWFSNINTGFEITGLNAFFYVLMKYICPIYSIWAIYITFKIISKSLSIFKENSSNKMTLSEIIKKLQFAIDSNFGKK